MFETHLHRFVLRFVFVGFTGAAFVLSGCGGSGSSHSPQPTPASNPTPTISSITPSSLVAGSSAQSITLAGTGFISSTRIDLNGASLVTTYVSSTAVTAAVPAAAITADGTAKISATNPSPGGGTSAVQSLTITVPVAAMTSWYRRRVSRRVRQPPLPLPAAGWKPIRSFNGTAPRGPPHLLTAPR